MATEDWMDYLIAHGRKSTTIENYRTQLKRCLETLSEYGRSTDPEEITVEDVFLLRDKLGISEGSTRKYLKILGMWTEWECGYNVFEDSDILWNPDHPKRLFITDSELNRMLAASGTRDRVALLLGSCMGLRRSEITNVRWSDIKNGRLTIHGKGHGESGKVVEMHIPPRVMEEMMVWKAEMEKMNLRDESGGCIVPAIQKGRFTHMVPTAMSHIVKAAGERAGVTATTHSLRRNFATTLYNRHVDLVDIKELMRHESVDTTVRCYIRADVTRLDAILDSF